VVDLFDDRVMTSALIVAAGSSRRMGFDKLAAPLAGFSVLERAVRALAGSGEFGEVILVTGRDRWDEVCGWVAVVAAEMQGAVGFGGFGLGGPVTGGGFGGGS
jgi:CTP:molybdopterin cytidylyltransferase MocA